MKEYCAAALDTSVLDPDVAEEEAIGLAEGTAVAVDAGLVELSRAAAVDADAGQAGGHGPHVHADDDAEAAAPDQRAGKATERGEELVAAADAAHEAAVGVLPHAVDAARVLRLPKDVLELGLQK